ncbi:SGNH/GDSL hydrolase family protein [Planococcus versutus]|uniref:Epsx protein n=1 Tax=Planococcus versutus TaxID=1302659 RepID=A0A1B1S2X1_9BACL|nr:SGNH/GDSL hydrolase family protein [Planococcus versutus]ANU27534.1 epsx protein [Planococcus versutus]
MKLTKIAAIAAVIICMIVLVFSYLTWQDKLENVLEPSDSAQAKTEKKSTSEEKEDPARKESVDLMNIEKLTANMDQDVQDLFSARADSGENVKLLIAGSAALESGDPGYAELLKTSLESAYADFIEVDVLSIEGTSDSLKRADLSKGYDVVLLEPMTLMNNDRIAIEQEREHIKAFEDNLQREVNDAIVILHPPQPIFGAGYYLAQVSALREFSTIYSYDYIDHWSAWPDTDDDKLKDYLTEDGLPNDKGAELWATELETYFIAN